MPNTTFSEFCHADVFPEGLSEDGANQYCADMKTGFDDCVSWNIKMQGAKIANAQTICKNFIMGMPYAGKFMVDFAKSALKNASVLPDGQDSGYALKTGLIAGGATLGIVAAIGTAICCVKKHQQQLTESKQPKALNMTEVISKNQVKSGIELKDLENGAGKRTTVRKKALKPVSAGSQDQRNRSTCSGK